MELIYQTGNPTVDNLSRLQITGNVIPSAWYRTIRKDTGKPYLNAIVILSDIVYWYRAAEIRDEGSGQLIGYRKRFKADLLQRSYQQMADQFGITKRDATNAVVELEKLGVIKRVFRTLSANGQSLPNVLFLELNVDVLEQLTFPKEQEKGKNGDRISKTETMEVFGNGYPRFEGDVSPKSEGGLTQISETSIQNQVRPISEISETNTEITYKDYYIDHPIVSYQEVKDKFKAQIDYEILKQDLNEGMELDELVELAVEILTSSAENIRINRENKPAWLVKEQYWRLNMFHIKYVLNCLSVSKTKAKNIRAVMITALYNSINTIETYYGNLYQCSQENKMREGFG